MAEMPQVFAFDEDDEDRAAEELARVLRDLGIESPLVVSSAHGRRVAAKIEGAGPVEAPHTHADQDWAAAVGSRAQDASADAIVAVGGGRCLDIGKLAATRAGLNVVVVPTQLSHDGICSPVAVVPNADGSAESLGAIAPRAVFLSMVTLLGAPAPSIAAGVGDLLANPLALKDWRLAAERGVSELDDRAWDLSAQSYELIQERLDEDPASWPKDREALRNLADALVLSGMAMIAAGTSRPASGGEHEVSHAIDELFGGRALHGAQVAFGCIVTSALHGEDAAGLRATLRKLHLPEEPSQLELDTDDLVRVILEAPDTRPGRFTIIEDANLDEAAVRRLIADIWS